MQMIRVIILFNMFSLWRGWTFATWSLLHMKISAWMYDVSEVSSPWELVHEKFELEQVMTDRWAKKKKFGNTMQWKLYFPVFTAKNIKLWHNYTFKAMYWSINSLPYKTWSIMTNWRNIKHAPINHRLEPQDAKFSVFFYLIQTRHVTDLASEYKVVYTHLLPY